MGEGGRDEEVAASKTNRIEDSESKNRYPIYDQNGGKMAKIDTLFMTKTAERPYPLYIAHMTEYPPYANTNTFSLDVSINTRRTKPFVLLVLVLMIVLYTSSLCLYFCCAYCAFQ